MATAETSYHELSSTVSLWRWRDCGGECGGAGTGAEAGLLWWVPLNSLVLFLFWWWGHCSGECGGPGTQGERAGDE